MSELSCLNCVFASDFMWDKDHKHNTTPIYCRKNSPSNTGFAKWPVVGEKDWCGDFVACDEDINAYTIKRTQIRYQLECIREEVELIRIQGVSINE